MTNLQLSALRKANRIRAAHIHSKSRDWCLAQWSNATLGELGEAANIIKKIDRGDFTLEAVREDLAKEFADVLCYLDMLADAAGIDLSEATISKFNEVSIRLGSPVRLSESEAIRLVEGTKIRFIRDYSDGVATYAEEGMAGEIILSLPNDLGFNVSTSLCENFWCKLDDFEVIQ